MKVLFLDVDGVLNCSFTCVSAMIEADKVSLVNKIIRETNLEIVISSSWRLLYSLDSLESLLQDYGLITTLFSATPDLCWKLFDSVKDVKTKRGDEVNEWLLQHDGLVERYAILDDEDDFYENQPLFKCNPEEGLTNEIADAIIAYLSDSEEKGSGEG